TSAQLGKFEESNLDEPRFNVDVAAFRTADEDKVRLEIYYQIFNDGLRFFKKQDGFAANYEFNVVILGEDNKQLTGTSVERVYRVDDYQATRRSDEGLINVVALKIGKGEYRLVAKLIDKNSNKIGSIERDFKIDNLFKNETDLSGIEFVREVLEKDSSTSPFDKGEKRIIPAVSRQYGEDIGQISLFFEIYHTDPEPMNARLLYSVYDDRDAAVYDDDFELVLNKKITRFVKHIPLEEFVPGSYRLKVTLAEKNGKPISSSEAKFGVAWSLAALVRNDYDLALEQLKYVAQKNEIDELKDVPEDKREEAFADFWKDHDPTPETPENERMEKYYGRIKFANRAFSSIHIEGWRTDMGMVYIIYGEPDHIERHPFELDSKPYQLWYYYSLSRTFGFVDENGTGDYRLQFPYDGRSGFIDDKIDDYD
ncbi:MAG: GWxTD domain-containing protein, partial [candidate division Zixibacteria bacterium]|nr:GWxTD domain-containing protein [candidate division Zixibacteria bacterium]NIR63504.1 GWxTD domain-containing protein [candidate division Zixibacteria bacterium]NIS16238.1 GWxTD domain-containing protein [candidate division Zixibacteria bacterium]NIS45457.1 GWxTD domain-containing protein [candidate division Zixibacteria bacterium]NIT52628.1 GWxTD domain-containing protein [candidate division Zixibacteria bacterium]